jgi:HNH endonuclease
MEQNVPNDPYYKTLEWKRLRARIIARSSGMCEAPGCLSPGVTVDHIVARRSGGADAPHNLRHLCRRCDNAVKENERGQRRRGGKLPSGCDVAGMPTDDAHPFYGNGGSNITTECVEDRRGSRLSTKFRKGG